MSERILVIAIGNRLVGDDAVGPAVYDALLEVLLPEHVDLKLLGVGGVALLDTFDTQALLIVVDAVRWGGAPGSIHVTDINDIHRENGMPITSHDIGFSDVLRVGDRLFPEKMPRMSLFVGIEGMAFDELGSPLSAPVKAAVPKVVDLIRSYVRKMDDVIPFAKEATPFYSPSFK